MKTVFWSFLLVNFVTASTSNLAMGETTALGDCLSPLRSGGFSTTQLEALTALFDTYDTGYLDDDDYKALMTEATRLGWSAAKLTRNLRYLIENVQSPTGFSLGRANLTPRYERLSAGQAIEFLQTVEPNENFNYIVDNVAKWQRVQAYGDRGLDSTLDFVNIIPEFDVAFFSENTSAKDMTSRASEERLSQFLFAPRMRYVALDDALAAQLKKENLIATSAVILSQNLTQADVFNAWTNYLKLVADKYDELRERYPYHRPHIVMGPNRRCRSRAQRTRDRERIYQIIMRENEQNLVKRDAKFTSWLQNHSFVRALHAR